ncbi:MAG: hypothetical protein Q8M20_04335 [Rhodocyclaceae bacterium]|nr:hypothetical protein [Rhodocyclaceae bacterium]
MAQMQAVFLDNWIKATGGSESMHLMYLLAITSAQHSIHLSSAYFVPDKLMVSVGSTNFDTCSFRLNDEANLNIYAADFARQQVDVFNAELARSRRVSLQEWQQRQLAEKFLEHAASLIGAQL